MIETVTDIRNFWHPLAVMGLAAYFIFVYGRFWDRTKRRYEALFGAKNREHTIFPPMPLNDGSAQDAEFKTFYYPEKRTMLVKITLTWVAIIALSQVY